MYGKIHEQLRGQYPRWLWEFIEFDNILYAQSKLLCQAESTLEKIYNNAFIGTADDEILLSLEEFLNIKINPNKEREERIDYVRSHFVGFGHIGYLEIQDIIRNYTDASFEISRQGNIFYVVISMDNNSKSFNYDDCMVSIKNRLPAELILNFEMKSLPEVRIYAGVMCCENILEVIHNE